MLSWLRTRTAPIAALLSGGALLAVVLALSGGGGPIETRPARDTLGWPIRGWLGSAAGGVMYRLGVPAKSGDLARIEEDGPDGPMPVTLWTSFESKARPEEILRHYRASCRKLGLALPAQPEAAEPGLVCDGTYRGRLVSVIVKPDCGDDRCDVFVEVRGNP